MSNERFLKDLRELGVLYSKTKRYILRAEQVDPQSRSNIAIFKEQRDALDHVMRALWAHFEKEQDEDYLCGQIEKARGHLFRAAYDALDGAGISFKLRIAEYMEGISNEAISAVYPNYYDHVVEINQIDLQIVEHRKRKDIGKTTMQNMDDYSAVVDRLAELSDLVTGKTPAFHQWQRRHRKTKIIWAIAIPAAFIVLSFVLFFLKDLYWRHHPTELEKQSGTVPVPSVSASPLPAISPTASP
ncbi:MAG TPA: hypothetical protein VGZ31_09120 [Chthoniobacterales bacterium]|nr:hypothetical protein [Chthoniobacterales bacterium]